MPITIENVSSNFEREPLETAYGFKGGFMTNVWQGVAMMESSTGKRGIGLGTQNVLWSDADVFAAHSESGGNALMYAMTEKALQLAKGMSFETPIDLLDELLDKVHAYGKEVTGHSALTKVFALNALIAVDNAAWLLYAEEHGISDFDELIPEPYRPGLSYEHERVASMPSFGYASTVEAIKEVAAEGYYIMKVKLGHPGTQAEMLEKDKKWLSAIHNAIGHIETPHTENGRVPYFLDPNTRYESKDILRRLLDHARDIGAYDQILVVEEPFPPEERISVNDFDVNIAADESAHSPEDVVERIEMGYGSIVLKAIAKTLSMTMKMAQTAYEHDTPCFCADLTVNPILLDWNKNVAARLAPLPGIETGLMEANGWQSYAGWERMEGYHPCTDASWRQAEDGVFKLGEDYYEKSGCIFQLSDHYEEMFQRA